MAPSIKIRMYNTGFGDCFLLTFSNGQHPPRRVLIDCGSHQFGPGPFPIKEIVEDLIGHIGEDGNPRIDIVVATHRHRDHVSGFEHGMWSGVEVDEVWMPWTEHPTNAEAREIRERQSAVAHRLCAAIGGLNLEEEEAAYRLAFAGNNLSNAEAMRTLHHGFKRVKRRRFLPYTARKKNSFKIECLPDVEVHVMGPSRDRDVIRDMDPPSQEAYLRMTGADGSARAAVSPFPSMPDWSRDEFVKRADWADLLADFPDAFAAGISEETAFDEMLFAAGLEQSVNGTSLMLMFRMGSAHLLFPGDAQWGTWKAAMNNPVWRHLLAKTTFYKVGHHGSHNATPVQFVEQLLPADAVAMVPTRLMKRWPFIPKTDLLDALDSRGIVYARSDTVPGAQQFTCHQRDGKPFYFEVEIPAAGV